MLEQIESIICREAAFLPKFMPGTPQHSLLVNRIAALNTVRTLLTNGPLPAREELEFALPRIVSILCKSKKARDKYEPGSWNFLRTDPLVRLMESAQTLILQAMEAYR